MSFPGDSRSAYYAGGNPPAQLMQGPRSMQGMPPGMPMPPLYASNQGVPIPPYAVAPALGVARGMPMGMQQPAISMQQQMAAMGAQSSNFAGLSLQQQQQHPQQRLQQQQQQAGVSRTHIGLAPSQGHMPLQGQQPTIPQGLQLQQQQLQLLQQQQQLLGIANNPSLGSRPIGASLNMTASAPTLPSSQQLFPNRPIAPIMGGGAPLAGLPVSTADFPALGGVASRSLPSNAGSGVGILSASGGQFLAEEFPALLGGAGGGGSRAQSAALHSDQQSGLQLQHSALAPAPPASQFGMLGLLQLLGRAADAQNPSSGNSGVPNDNLALLGLNISAPEPIHDTFASPWGDAGRPLAKSCVPTCFQLQPFPLQQVHLRQMKDASLLYMFYNLHRDPVHNYRRNRTETLAAQELISRNWIYLRERNVWVSRRPTGEWLHFDPVAWETRLTPAEWLPVQGAPSGGAMGGGGV